MSFSTGLENVGDVETQIRRNTGHAALAAGLLIFFGFFAISGAIGSEFFLSIHWVFHNTLKFGGIAMVGVAIWTSLGLRSALLADCVVSCAIGLILTLTGLLMLFGGIGFLQMAIIVVAGITFATSGFRSWRDYVRFKPVTIRLGKDSGTDVDLLLHSGHKPAKGTPTDPAAKESTGPARKPVVNYQTSGSRFAVNDEAIQLPSMRTPETPARPASDGDARNAAD